MCRDCGPYNLSGVDVGVGVGREIDKKYLL